MRKTEKLVDAKKTQGSLSCSRKNLNFFKGEAIFALQKFEPTDLSVFLNLASGSVRSSEASLFSEIFCRYI